jgi:hypothetical protein
VASAVRGLSQRCEVRPAHRPAYAVLPVFRRQRRGILINNISLGGWAPEPFAAACTASRLPASRHSRLRRISIGDRNARLIQQPRYRREHR